MIAVGGWGKRTERHGPRLRLRAGKFVPDNTPGVGGGHGVRHEFPLVIRDSQHPVARGLPPVWMHAEDELHDRLRGPAMNVADIDRTPLHRAVEAVCAEAEALGVEVVRGELIGLLPRKAAEQTTARALRLEALTPDMTIEGRLKPL